MKLDLTRSEVCRILLALTSVAISTGNTEKWLTLHDKVNEQLNSFDEKREALNNGRI